MFATCIGGTFQCGYNISVINAPTKYVQDFINQTWMQRYQTEISKDGLTLLWSTIVSIFTIGGFIGVAIGGTLSVKLGRRGTLLTNNVISLAAALLMGLSSSAGSFELLIIGRLLIGINAGIALCVEPMFLGEIAPTSLRGAMGTGSSIFLTGGILSGQVMGLKEVLGKAQYWPLLLSTTCIPALLQLQLLPWFPESPRYLLIDKGDEERCKKALNQLHGLAGSDSVLDDIQREKNNLVGFKAKKPWELFADRSIRWQVITIIVLNAAQQLNGVNAGMLVESLGRKVLISGGYILMSVCCILFTVTLALQQRDISALCPSIQFCWGPAWKRSVCQWGFYSDSDVTGSPLLPLFLAVLEDLSPIFPYLSVACVFAFVLSFGLGPGGVTNILTTEMFKQTTRPAAFMIAGSVNWLSFFFIGLLFPFIVIGLQHYCFLVFFVVCISVGIYIILVLPETKNKSFVEIQKEFQSRRGKETNSDEAEAFLISTSL
ncbi:hypothetical protein CRENBAI_022471 [Crenichthys baileyi]|uniref:Solute carrier family 2, facilitated glucose transporter member 5 n=1 Tax=Crenichthys baileyi TaxID=28760 RepID=A0AAV9R5R7_9TELE